MTSPVRALGGTPRPDELHVRIGGHSYRLASEKFLSGKGSTARRWSEKHRTSQNTQPQRFAIEMRDFSQGAGFSYATAQLPATYAWSSGFVADSPGVISTWPVRTSGASFNATDTRGWQFELGGYLYVARGRYVVKYKIEQGTTPWPIIERHDLDGLISGSADDGNVICGRPDVFKGKAYVPVRVGVAGTITRFQELTTVATTDVEEQTVAISSATGGTFTLTWDGKTTAAITAAAANAAAAALAVQTALRLLAGLEDVTVEASGTSPNWTYTITFTGAGGTLGAASVPQLTSSSSLTGGGAGIAHATTHAGTTDTWTLGPADTFAKSFRVYLNRLARLQGDASGQIDKNRVYFVEADPMVLANWSPAPDTGYEFGENGREVTDMAAFDVSLIVAKENGLFDLDQSYQSHEILPDYRKLSDPSNGVGMEVALGLLFFPTKHGLVQWDGSSRQVVGIDQEGLHNGNVDRGVGRVYSMAAAGEVVYFVANDSFRGDAILGSFRPTDARRSSPEVAGRGLDWHTHEIEEDARYENVLVLSAQGEPSSPKFPAAWSDDNAVGTLAWSNPGNAALDDGSVASASGTGQTHYLMGLSFQPNLPDEAEIHGIVAEVIRRGFATSSFTKTTNGGNITSTGTPYADAQTGADTLNTTTGAVFWGVRQQESLGTYALQEGFVEFDTSGIPDAAEILDAVIKFTPNSGVGGTWVLEARARDFGGGLTNGDWVAAASLGGLTLLATHPVTPGLTGLQEMTSEGDNLKDHINKTGMTRFMFCTDKQTAGTPPGVGTTENLEVTHANTTLTVVYKDITDTVVKLVIGGVVVGDNKASTTAWPGTFDVARYGGASDDWGTGGIDPDELNASDAGIVISATSTGAGTFEIDAIALTVYFTTPGQSEVATLMSILKVDETRTVAEPVIRQLPRDGRKVAYDPSLNRARDNATFQTARYVGPGRNVPKTYDFVEGHFEMSAPNGAGPALNLQYSLNDEDWEYLLDAAGNTLEVGAALGATGAGSVRAYFPRIESAWAHSDNHTIAVRVVLAAKTGDQVDSEVTFRDLVIYGWYRPQLSGEFSEHLVIGDVTVDGERLQVASAREALNDVRAACGPGSWPVEYQGPYGRIGYAVFEDPEVKEITFNHDGQEVPLYHVTLNGKWLQLTKAGDP